MELEERTCAQCRCKFKVIPQSLQTGCCRDHDARGQAYKKERTLRRKIETNMAEIYATNPWLKKQKRKKLVL